VGTGLAGSGVAAALGELGYAVDCLTFHDAPRRAHSVAAQGGINAARGRKVGSAPIVAGAPLDEAEGRSVLRRTTDC